MGMTLDFRMMSRLCGSRAKICKAPTVPSTISSIRTPSAYEPALWPLLALWWWRPKVNYHCYKFAKSNLTPCKSVNALVSKCTSLGIVCDSLKGAKFAEHSARFLIRPMTALTKGHLEGGCNNWATADIPSLSRTAFWATSLSACLEVRCLKINLILKGGL